MIKTGGENVASREVEEAIYTIAGVSEVAVIGLPHERWIEMVTAVVVPKAGAELSEDGLMAACRERLAAYKAPKRIILVDSLPKNPSGKLLKRQLRQQFGG
jgi:fatty-acyl-CoA synthase